MGRTAEDGGVKAKDDRIQVTFTWNSKTYRPTLDWRPTQTNLKRAAKLREQILEQIRQKTFVFAEHFPNYKFIDRISARGAGRTWGEVAADFLDTTGGLEYATRESYRKLIGYVDASGAQRGFWRWQRLGDNDTFPLGERPFFEIKYTELARFMGRFSWGANKTHNNKVSVLKQVFDFGYGDVEDRRNPADKLQMRGVQVEPPDPYTLAEALVLIEDANCRWGPSWGNYVEWQFFHGCRPSESIALEWPKYDKRRGTLRVSGARVMAHDKKTTKTGKVRDIQLHTRGKDIMRRQFALTGLAGKNIFGEEDGSAFHDLQVPWRRWVAAHKRLKIRYREPYQCRSTSVTWHLTIYPSNKLAWVARQHGHSVQVMLNTYMNWIEGTTDEDIEAIRAAFEMRPSAESSAESAQS